MPERIQRVEAFLADLHRLQVVFNSSPAELANLVMGSWVRKVISVGAIDTGAFIRSIDYRPDTEDMAGFQNYVVDTEKNTEVNYSSLIERGTENEDGSVRMAARWPAKQGIEAINFGSEMDGLVRSSFVHRV